MSRRRTRKTVDYSKFNADDENQGSDDDFQDSSFPPPPKKTKAKLGEKRETRVGDKKKQKSQPHLSDKEQIINSRKSRDEKQFEKELQQALEISRSESQEFSQDDDVDEGGESKACDASKVKKDPEKSGAHVSNDDVIIVSNENSDYQDGHKESDDDFDPGNNELENDDGDDDYGDGDEEISEDDDDDDFCVESDSDGEFHGPKSKKRRLSVKDKNSAEKKKAKVNKNAKGNSAKSKGTRKCSTKSSSTTPALSLKQSPLSPAGGRKKGAVKNGFKSPATAATLTTTLGNSSRSSPGLVVNSSPGLGGVIATNARPGGLRLGLSRNVRIAKPLHSNITIK